MATIPGHLDQLEMTIRSMRLNYKRGEMSVGEAILALADIANTLRAIKGQNDSVYHLVLASDTQHHVKEITETYYRISEVADILNSTAREVKADVAVLRATEETKSVVSA